MSRDQGPLNTREGGAQVNTDLPQPTDGGDWVPVGKAEVFFFWARFIALAFFVISLVTAFTIFFF